MADNKTKIFEYLNHNISCTRDVLIDNLIKEFGVTKSTAVTYYYSWKKEFMKPAVVTPEIENTIDMVNRNKELKLVRAIYKGKFGTYTIDSKGLIYKGEEFNNKDDIKKYKQTKLEELNNEIQELEAALKLIP